MNDIQLIVWAMIITFCSSAITAAVINFNSFIDEKRSEDDERNNAKQIDR